VAIELLQGVAAVVERLRVCRPCGERALEGGKRAGGAARLEQADAEIVQRFGIAGLVLEQLLVALGRLGVAAERLQRRAAVVERLSRLGRRASAAS